MLNTEKRNEKTTHIDKMKTVEILETINSEDAGVIKAVSSVIPEIALIVDKICERLKKGGRLFYIGAGTSGRLAVADAAECPPTFGVSGELVQGIIAGGYKTMVKASENEEDNAEQAIADLRERKLKKEDILIGISASGGAAYIISALKYAKSIGCATACISSNRGCPISKIADVAICPDTGAEVITGSTRMKAGTSQKLILNMISTSVMIKLGMVYENLMINLKPTNKKLRNRMIGIVKELTDTDEEKSEALLDNNGWNIRKATDAYLK